MSKRSGRRWFSTPLDPGWATVIAALIGTIGLLAVALLSRVSLVPTPPSTATITLAENPIATFTFAPTFAPLRSETPVPTIVPSQTAYPISSGHLDIPEGGQADLDTGQVSHIGADILFEVVSANDRFIDPLIGSRGAIYGASVDPPGIEGCMSRNLT